MPSGCDDAWVDQKEFMRDVYADYWLSARDKKYGFLTYDRHLCELLSSRLAPGSVLFEVAIGTGYPIADFLQKSGYSIRGIDISAKLIERCRELNPAVEAEVGDAENLRFAADTFDATYCFHASWYFPDLARAIGEMLRVTKPGGLIVFDIQNRDNPAIAADFARRTAQVRPGLVSRAQLQARNVAKVVLRRGNPNWHGVIYEVPTYPQDVLKHLGDMQVTVLGRREDDQSLVPLRAGSDLTGYPRLVFMGKKPV